MRLMSRLILLMVIVVAGESASVSYFCPMDGVVRAECCCKPDGERLQKPSASEEREPESCCCEVRVVTHNLPSALSQPAQVHEAGEGAAAASAESVSGGDTSLPRYRVESDLAWPPDPGPPLFSRNCSYLI